MRQCIKRFLSIICITLVSLCFLAPSFCETTNLPAGDIGDYGAWATENNLKKITTDLSSDIENFQGDFQNKVVADYVPAEAKIGLAFMNGLSYIAQVLNSSLVRFMIVFIIVMYLLWVTFEAYTIIIGQGKVAGFASGKGTMFEIVKRGALVLMWIAVLKVGPAQAFMMVMSPILQVANYISDGILTVASGAMGVDELPDTCAAIREYATAHISDDNILSASQVSDIMCLPSRLSGFCYSAVAVGWRWMLYGIGTSAFSFLCGLIFVCGFVYLTWRFVFIAFGVIADLFLAVMLLPFTALSETVKETSYKGIIGRFYNGFLGVFNVSNINKEIGSLESQIGRIIDAALHFIVLSIVITLCSAFLSQIVTVNSMNGVPHFDSPGFFITILILALAIYFAKQAETIATELGGSINTSIGDNLRNDVKGLWNLTKKNAEKIRDIIRDRKK